MIVIGVAQFGRGQDAVVILVGDPESQPIGPEHADLAGGRVELLWRYGPAVMADFSACYLRHNPLDVAELPVWELFVVTAGTAFMGQWGLPDAVEAEMRARSGWLLRQAAARLG